jgi:hypothetical protein
MFFKKMQTHFVKLQSIPYFTIFAVSVMATIQNRLYFFSPVLLKNHVS